MVQLGAEINKKEQTEIARCLARSEKQDAIKELCTKKSH